MLKTRSRAIAFALSGIVFPGLHKFYLNQRGWGIAYLLLYPTHIPQLASVLEGMWYAWLGEERFEQRFNPAIAHFQSSPYAPLHTSDDIQLAVRLGLTIDVNRATLRDWQRLPQLSSAQAALIVRLSQEGLQFNSVDDLAAALGVPLTTLEPLVPVMRFYYYDFPDMPVVGNRKSNLDSDLANSDNPPPFLDNVDGDLPLNPNQATLAKLMMIPDMNEAIARQIIEQRQNQPYTDLMNFKERLSLSAERTSELMHYIRL